MTMRGVSVEPRYFYPDGSIQELESWGVNLVRLHIIENSKWAGHTVVEGVNTSMKIVIDALNQGSKIQFLWNLRLECRCDYRAYLKHWQWIVPWINSMPNVLGFDVVNEPTDTDERMEGYRGALPVLHQAMRQLTDKWLVFQSGYGGTDSGFEFLAPFGDEKTMYGHNIYTPWRYTSQGLKSDRVIPYPEDLEQLLLEDNKHFFRFNDLYPEAKLIVPEFGLSRAIPDDEVDRYVDALVPMLEERGISYCWHNYPGRTRPPREGLKKWWRLNDGIL